MAYRSIYTWTYLRLPKNANIIKNFAEKVQYLYIFRKYLAVGTSMQKIISPALLVRQLRWNKINTK